MKNLTSKDIICQVIQRVLRGRANLASGIPTVVGKVPQTVENAMIVDTFRLFGFVGELSIYDCHQDENIVVFVVVRDVPAQQFLSTLSASINSTRIMRRT